MRTATQVSEPFVFVDGNFGFLGHRVAVLIQIAGFQTLDQLQFVRLVVKDLFGFVRADHLAVKCHAGLDDPAHALLYAFEVFKRQRPGQVEIVVEPIIDGWTDRHFCAGKFFQHRLRHDVRGGVPNLV